MLVKNYDRPSERLNDVECGATGIAMKLHEHFCLQFVAAIAALYLTKREKKNKKKTKRQKRQKRQKDIKT